MSVRGAERRLRLICKKFRSSMYHTKCAYYITSRTIIISLKMCVDNVNMGKESSS